MGSEFQKGELLRDTYQRLMYISYAFQSVTGSKVFQDSEPHSEACLNLVNLNYWAKSLPEYEAERDDYAASDSRYWKPGERGSRASDTDSLRAACFLRSQGAPRDLS